MTMGELMTKRGWKYMEKLTEYNFKVSTQELLTNKCLMFWWKIGSTINTWFWTFWYYNPIYTFFYKLKYKDE